MNTADNSVIKISDDTADHITSDGEKIVYKKGDKLYLLGDEPVEIYEGDFETFAILSGTNRLAVVQYSLDYELVKIPD